MRVRMYGGSSMSNTSPYGRNFLHGTSSSSSRERLASNSVSRTTGVARTTVSRPTGSYSTSRTVNTSTSGYTSGRQLPDGPGPLPNRYSRDRESSDGVSVRYVAQPTRRRDEQLERNSSSYTGTTAARSTYDRRKISSDSGYDSNSTYKTRPGFTTTDKGSSRYNKTLASRRSKSYSSIDSLADLSLNDSKAGRSGASILKGSSSGSYKTDDYSFRSYKSNGLSTSRTKTLESLPKTSDSSSVYMQSSSHSDYKSPVNRYKSSSNANSSPESPSMVAGTSPAAKKSSVIIDYNENRRETITASPDALRKQSSSSESSSLSPTPNGHRGSERGLLGLRNLGNTCFMNSILQCLSNTRILTDQLLKGSYADSINSRSSMKGKLIQAYADLTRSMWKTRSESAISPYAFKTQIQRFAPRFVGYNQQDAQEFLHFLLEGLHDDLNCVQEKPKYKMCEFENSMCDSEKAAQSWKHYLARDNSLITDLFVGQLKSTLTCIDCGYKSVTFDPFWDLSLPIPRKSSGFGSYRSSSLTSTADVNIRDCMELFTKEEVLDGDERPTCEKCKKKRKSTKKFTVQRFPRILVLHLKRFSGFGFRSKLQTNVDFPVTSPQDLGEFASDTAEGRSAVYSLYAVSNHSGTTYGGHYTAYCKHLSTREWHCFNDARVEQMSLSRVRGSQAYILFFEKLDRQSLL